MTSNISGQANKRYQIEGTAYHRLLAKAPYLPRCSNNKTAAKVRPREYAIRYPYMQVNQPDMVSWLVFDLDHEHLPSPNPMIWDDEGLPAPNFIVKNRKNGKSHLFYAIVSVCTSVNARSHPIQYMKAIYEAMAVRLGADMAYRGPIAKTPGHPWWQTHELHSYEYELGELADYVDLPEKPPWSKGPNLESVSHSRHMMLFEDLRFYAYSIVGRERDNGTYHSFVRALEAYAHNKNSFKQFGFDMNLSLSQVRSTVKSVARWTWDKYSGDSRCHRGVMRLDASLSLKDKQRLSAKRTHNERRNKTETTIKSACRVLLRKGQVLTQIALAEATGFSRQTIAKYKHIFSVITMEIIKASLNVINLGEDSKIINVKNGVHKILAEPSELKISHGSLLSDDKPP